MVNVGPALSNTCAEFWVDETNGLVVSDMCPENDSLALNYSHKIHGKRDELGELPDDGKQNVDVLVEVHTTDEQADAASDVHPQQAFGGVVVR